jgi:hypothetical protein
LRTEIDITIKKNKQKELSLLKRDENFFLEKSSEGVLKPPEWQQNHAMRKKNSSVFKNEFLNPPPLQEEEL